MSELHIAVIGAGGIGCRHLQSLAGMDRPVRLYAVDPSPDSLARAKENIHCAPGVALTCLADSDKLPEALDLAVVATSSLVRRQAVERLLDRHTLRYLVLEKFLFPQEADYDAVGALLQAKKVCAYVNCARRMQPGYAQMQKEIARDGGPLLFAVAGGEFGLACNGVHYADAAAFLTGDEETFAYNPSMLCPEIRPCKRAGYVEFAGTLNAVGSRGSALSLTATPGSGASAVCCLYTPKRRYILDEGRQTALYAAEENGYAWEERAFPMLYQSQLSAAFAAALLDTGTCPLPRYADSVKVHLPLLRAFLQHYGRLCGKEESVCPIT